MSKSHDVTFFPGLSPVFSFQAAAQSDHIERRAWASLSCSDLMPSESLGQSWLDIWEQNLKAMLQTTCLGQTSGKSRNIEVHANDYDKCIYIFSDYIQPIDKYVLAHKHIWTLLLDWGENYKPRKVRAVAQHLFDGCFALVEHGGH